MNFDKMVLVPFDSQINNNDLITVILKLAKTGAFNTKLFMKINNKFNKKVPICDYINSLSNDKVELEHEKDFINLLKQANIDLNLIKNERIKGKLVENEDKLYTTESPIKRKLKDNSNKNNKKTNKWITVN